MTIQKFRIAAVAATLALALTSGTAEAAKGVKKNNATNAPRIVTGQIQNVTYANSGGSIFLKTPNNNQNQAGAAVKLNQPREFLATTNTRLVNYNGTPGNPTSLQRGVRVRLLATGSNTSSIQILTHPRMSGHVARMGANNYRPHMAYHHLHPNHHRRR